MNRKDIRRLVLMLLAVLVLSAAGCTKWWLATNAASFAAGWLARGALTSDVTTCYRNGEPVDCTSLPTDLTQ